MTGFILITKHILLKMRMVLSRQRSVPKLKLLLPKGESEEDGENPM